jgi:D-alanyl-D-alanine carboxypeptidase (penicillin-binding protein 5/6)
MGTSTSRRVGAALTLAAVVALTSAVPAGATGASPSPSPTPGASTTLAPQNPATAPIGGAGLAGHGVKVSYGPDAKPVPKVLATSWVLADLGTGDVLASKSAHLKRPPASTLKTLTAVTLIPRLDPDATYKTVWADVAVEGSRAGLVDNATYRVEDLFYGLLLPSGNDAAHALANANGGLKRTVAEMNEVARQLQALDTVAKTPHGLDTPGQVSSAYDLALIARAGMQLADFRTYVATLHHDFPGRPAKKGHKRKTFELWNQNRLLRDGYRGVLGVKTGYTTKAGRTFVAAAERGDRTLVVTLMGITEPSETAAKKLLDWGFRQAAHVTPVGTLVDPVEPTTTVSDESPAPDVEAAAGPIGNAPVHPATEPVSAPLPWARWAGLALVVDGAVVALLSLRGRRRETRSRQRLIAAARRAR